jgi:serine/threonine protein kinase/tetratricopeptide (TPR) repeat protein
VTRRAAEPSAKNKRQVAAIGFWTGAIGKIQDLSQTLKKEDLIQNPKSKIQMVGSTFHHYKIIEKLGAGGQGSVYKAVDQRLGRTVVIKVLPPELTQKSANLKRFLREAQLCSQLDHPNICTIFDFGEFEGMHYIAMQFVEGKTVRQLVNGKPLELKSAISIAIQVCDGLAAAHQRGIIHRDIKAGNVIVSPAGQAKILDFGLAKLVEDETSAESSNIDRTDLTEVGVPYGTATYAAPEQARGDKVDHRADIFSTGVLLYELLAGIWAFQGKTVVEVRYAVMHEQPVPIAQMRPDPVPPRIQAILDKSLAKDPRDRYQKITDFQNDLREVLREITGVVPTGEMFAPRHISGTEKNVVRRAWGWLTGKSKADGSAGGSSSQRSFPSGAPSFNKNINIQRSSSQDITQTSFGEKKSIAILPFKNLSGDAASAFYEFSLADAVTTELAGLRSLIVRPSSVISKYQGKDVDPRQAGQEMQVSAVLSASFLRAGGKMRVTAQLLDVATGDILWSDRIDSNTDDIFSLQDLIAGRVLKGLELELSSKEQERLGKKATENAAAYEEYLRGRDNFGRFVFKTLAAEDANAAIENMKRAIELDPKFALAHSGLGAIYANRVIKGMGDTKDYDRAEAAFSQAIQLDENVVEARVLMALIYLSRGEKKKARAELSRLKEQFPNDGATYFASAMLHRLDGEYDKALKAWNKLEKLDPAAKVVACYNRARIHAYRGDNERALAELDKGARIEPNHPLIRIFRARILFYHGEVRSAIEIMREVLDEHPHLEGMRPILALMLASIGETNESRANITPRSLQMARADHDMAYWTASAYAQLGEIDSAFEWLERAIKLGNENIGWFERDSNLDPIRDDPRFAELMRQIKGK